MDETASGSGSHEAVSRFLAQCYIGRGEAATSKASLWAGRLLSYCGGLQGIQNPDKYVEFMTMMRDSFSRTTYDRTRNIIYQFMGWAKAVGLIKNNPAEFVKAPMSNKPYARRRTISHQQFKDLLLAANRIGYQPIEGLLILGYYTGMAIIDCCTLQWSNVDMENCVIHAPRMKTRTTSRVLYTVPFEPGSMLYRWLKDRQEESKREDIVKQWPNDPDRGIIFVDHLLAALYHAKHSGQSDRLYKWLQRVFKAAKVDRTFHDFRRGMATTLANSDIPMGQALQIIGHSSPKQLMEYVVHDGRNLRDGFRRVIEDRDETEQRVRHHRDLSSDRLRPPEHQKDQIDAGHGANPNQ